MYRRDLKRSRSDSSSESVWVSEFFCMDVALDADFTALNLWKRKIHMDSDFLCKPTSEIDPLCIELGVIQVISKTKK